MQEPVLVLATLWWIVFCAVVGLTLGSYLNVVIYRIPRGISTTLPRWSFCPSCESPIQWYDNLPVLSYLRLRGRCRKCGAIISPRYPIIELLTATVTLVLLDAFCVARARTGLHPGLLGLTEQLSLDWPIVLAHVILFVCLLGMSAIDLEHYFIDIRFTDFAVVMGFILHALWTPWSSREWHRPGVTASAVSIVAIAGLGLTWLVLRIVYPARDQAAEGPGDPGEGESGRGGEGETGTQGGSLTLESGDQNPRPEPAISSSPAPGPQSPAANPQSAVAGARVCGPDGQAVAVGRSPARQVGLLIAGLVFLGVLVATGIDALSPELAPVPSWRLLVPMVVFFGFIVAAGAPRRDSDTEIVTSIEAERGSARSVALQELLLLTPAVVLGLAALWLCVRNQAVWDWAYDWLNWSPGRTWRPILGLSTAAAGYVIGGAIGWGVRILFTLVLGREAFGTGDIHLMAAAGCIAGWPVVVLGFFLTCFLALAGWVVTLPFKRTGAIPLVPWLSLAFLAVVVFLEPITHFGPVRNIIDLVELLSNKSQGG